MKLAALIVVLLAVFVIPAAAEDVDKWIQDLNDTVSSVRAIAVAPVDLLFKFGKVYHYDLGEQELISEVPKKVLDLEARLGLSIFPILTRS